MLNVDLNKKVGTDFTNFVNCGTESANWQNIGGKGLTFSFTMSICLYSKRENNFGSSNGIFTKNIGILAARKTQWKELENKNLIASPRTNISRKLKKYIVHIFFLSFWRMQRNKN